MVNFQSWLDPFLIISALPAALAGIVWFLFLTNTRLSVPALTGAIMCMGVATANSILVVSFAREQLEILVGDARKAALNAGFVRLRPVLMTALAMIIGMVPMALGLGDGGEQNAPLGRAVIGGLLLATVATLFFVPAFFSLIHGRIERHRKLAHGAGAASDFRRIRRDFGVTFYEQRIQSPNPQSGSTATGLRRRSRSRSRRARPLLVVTVLLVVAAGSGRLRHSCAAGTPTRCWPSAHRSWPRPR